MEQSSLIGRRRNKVNVDFAPPQSDGSIASSLRSHQPICKKSMFRKRHFFSSQEEHV